MNDLSVLILLSSSGRGGREINTLRLIPYLQNLGIAVTLVVLDKGGYVTQKCSCSVVNYYSLGLWPSRLNFLAVLWRLFLLLRKTGPDLVQVYGFFASMFCRIAARPVGVKVVVGIVGAGHFKGLRPLCERLTKPLVYYYAANSLAGKREMCKILHDPQLGIRVIYNGVPEYKIALSNMQKKSITVGTVANLRPEKGYNVMLEALAQAKAKLQGKVSIKYLIAGEGTMRETLEHRIYSLGLTEQVSLLGAVENISEVLCKIDIFVLPSYSEGLPNALLEAMMAGRCAIATRVGGVPEIIEDGYSGLLVDPGNPEELARALIKMSLEPRLRESMALKGQEVAKQKFSLPRQAEETCKFWSEICHENLKEVRK